MTHPLPLHPSPLAAYQYAAGALARECRTLGPAEAAARFEPRRIYGGWWSPLFCTVLRVREGQAAPLRPAIPAVVCPLLALPERFCSELGEGAL